MVGGELEMLNVVFLHYWMSQQNFPANCRLSVQTLINRIGKLLVFCLARETRERKETIDKKIIHSYLAILIN